MSTTTIKASLIDNTVPPPPKKTPSMVSGASFTA